jgi:adenine-specific DNA methylase
MRRLIEEAFPLKKVSEDSKHEKSAGRKGHISTLHIWPARRPLAASRAAVIGTLLPDPADAPPEVRTEYERLAASPDPVKQREELCRRIEKITRWGKSGELNEHELDVFRDLIRKTYGGRAPTVLDIFAGGGAIPLEVMRLGAHAVAVEYNPVAWFILKCTIDFPSRLAGKTWRLPAAPAASGQIETADIERRNGDLAAHVRYWGRWVRGHVEQDLAPYFPKVNGQNPVAYFWARTVPCQDPKCGGTVALLKTPWLCTKKGKKRALRLKPNATSRRVDFEVFTPQSESEVGNGTVANAKAFCPFHDPPMPLTAKYIKECGKQDRMGVALTAVAVEGTAGKEYRAPTHDEIAAAQHATRDVATVMTQLPGGALHEPLVEVRPAPNTRGVSSLARFGIVHYGQVFAPRQQLALGVIAKWTRAVHGEVLDATGDTHLAEAVVGYLYCVLARSADRNSSICTWQTGGEFVGHTFAKYALPMTWDFCEVPATSESTGGYSTALDLVVAVVEQLATAASGAGQVSQQSATHKLPVSPVDAIVTDRAILRRDPVRRLVRLLLRLGAARRW